MGTKGRHHVISKETRQKINKALTGRSLSEEHKKRIGEANKGRLCSKETRKKLSEANKGQIPWHKGLKNCFSKEVRQKISEGNKGRIVSEETRRKISEGNKGKVRSEEHRKKVSGKNSSSWKGGISFEAYPSTFNSQLRDRVRVRDNFICQLCCVPELEYYRKLDVHHIDYNKRNCKMGNLIALCHSCNSKVNKDREKWQMFFEDNVGEWEVRNAELSGVLL